MSWLDNIHQIGISASILWRCTMVTSRWLMHEFKQTALFLVIKCWLDGSWPTENGTNLAGCQRLSPLIIREREREARMGICGLFQLMISSLLGANWLDFECKTRRTTVRHPHKSTRWQKGRTFFVILAAYVDFLRLLPLPFPFARKNIQSQRHFKRSSRSFFVLSRLNRARQYTQGFHALVDQ